MPPSDAKALYEQLVEYAHSQFENVQTGIFAADMKVHLINDGPVTFNLEVEDKYKNSQNGSFYIWILTSSFSLMKARA